jgi:hypothetical protein
MPDFSSQRGLATWQVIVLGLSGLVFVGGLVLLVVGVGGIVHQNGWKNDSVEVQGTVVANEAQQGTDSDGHSQTYQHAIIECPTPDGGTARLRDSVGQSPGHHVGDKMTIRYKTADPQGTARIWTFWRVYLLWTILAAVGAVPVVIAVVAVVLVLAIPAALHKRAAPTPPTGIV